MREICGGYHRIAVPCLGVVVVFGGFKGELFSFVLLGLASEIAVHQFALHLPCEVVVKGFRKHEVAAFGEKYQPVWRGNSKLVFGFGRISSEAINALYKAVSVSFEISMCGSGSLVNRVNLLESYYALSVVFLDRELLIVYLD